MAFAKASSKRYRSFSPQSEFMMGVDFMKAVAAIRGRREAETLKEEAGDTEDDRRRERR